MLAANAGGLIWDETAIASSLADPSAWAKTSTGEAAAKSKLSVKLTEGAENLAANLATLK